MNEVIMKDMFNELEILERWYKKRLCYIRYVLSN